MESYQDFLARKRQADHYGGFDPVFLPDSLMPFQAALTEWAIRKGRAAIFADCGLGKTLMQLVWAENVVRKTNRAVLILTPLSVAQQTLREGAKFGIEVHRTSGGSSLGPGIWIANYEKLHHFQSGDFGGVVADESSAIKAFNGKRRALVTEFMRTVPYRLLATATAAPNDYIELGTSSEALGEMGHMDMLTRFFRNDQNTCDSRLIRRAPPGWGGPHSRGWRFKGHAEDAFWMWVCSWARACRRPSDLGFEDDAFILPPLEEQEHMVEARSLPEGFLFSLPATNLREEREERRRTIAERCASASNSRSPTTARWSRTWRSW